MKIKKALYALLLPFFVPLILSAQISGTVHDESGEPLPFASVFVRNSTNGTVTNGKGMYKLTVNPGSYELVFQYIGYKQRIVTVQVGAKPVVVNAKLEPSNLEIKEVVITGEDPAYRIMREAIAKRKYYKALENDYTCDVYLKGMYKMVDAPKKIMGKDLGNMGGVLDSNRNGILYLSESVSKLYAQLSPPRKKEVMISSKVSGSNDAFSLNRATFVDFNLYDEHLEIEREILSPLADNAFSYYQFKYLGEYKDANGYTVNKIKVIPKRASDPTFSGFLYIVDNLWNLAGVDLFLNGNAIKQPVLDTLNIRQEFIPVSLPDHWRPLSQSTTFKIGIFGIHIKGFFNSVFSNYVLKPVFPAGLFTKEAFKVDQGANERDSTYWATLRPVPLTVEESRDYVKKDSLQHIWKSQAYMDSTDRKNNKFEIMNVFTGYSWRNSFKKSSLSVPGAFQWIQFNTVQGWLVNIQPEFTKFKDKYRSQYWKVEGTLNYGFSEKKWRGGARVEHRFERIHYSTLLLEGGSKAEQFNGSAPITPFMNMAYSLFAKENYMKLYEKTFARARWSERVLPDLSFDVAAEWADRRLLQNNTSLSWYKGDRVYQSNKPIPGDLGFGDPANAQKALFLDLGVRFHPGTTYSSYPGFRTYEGSEWPLFYFNYRKAVPGIGGSVADFDFVKVGIRKNSLTWGLFGYTDIHVTAGMFLRNKNSTFIDFYHPNGNLVLLAKPDGYTDGFLNLPYYAYSTDKPFIEGHIQHCFQGWLLDKLPLLRKLNWKEVLGVGMYYTSKTFSDPGFNQSLPYWEINAGFKNIGIKAIRPLRVDVVNSFYGQHFGGTAVVLGLTI